MASSSFCSAAVTRRLPVDPSASGDTPLSIKSVVDADDGEVKTLRMLTPPVRPVSLTCLGTQGFLHRVPSAAVPCDAILSSAVPLGPRFALASTVLWGRYDPRHWLGIGSVSGTMFAHFALSLRELSMQPQVRESKPGFGDHAGCKSDRLSSTWTMSGHPRFPGVAIPWLCLRSSTPDRPMARRSMAATVLPPHSQP